MISNDVKKFLAGQQNLQCQQCGDPISEIDHIIPRACHGTDALENYAYLCAECHKNKTCELDNMKINMEDHNPWVSRFNQETWEGFVESKKPLQVLAKLHEAVEENPCFEIDVRSCRLNGILEGNIEDIPVFSPLDTFEKPLLHQLYDYQWIDIGYVRSPLKCYEYDGARWYSKAEAKVLLQTGICKWNDFQLGFNATSHHKASSLANILRKIAPIWMEVGKSFPGEVWAADKIKKQDIPNALCKRAMLAMIGMWGRIHSYKYTMKTGHRHDCLFEGQVAISQVDDVLYDVTYKQKLLSYATLLPLNLIGRAQERLQIGHALRLYRKYAQPESIIAIRVDAVYVQLPKRNKNKILKKFKSEKYENIGAWKWWMKVGDNTSQELVYKVSEKAVPDFDSELTIQDAVQPVLKDLQWKTYVEKDDNTMEAILDLVPNNLFRARREKPMDGKTTRVP